MFKSINRQPTGPGSEHMQRCQKRTEVNRSTNVVPVWAVAARPTGGPGEMGVQCAGISKCP